MKNCRPIKRRASAGIVFDTRRVERNEYLLHPHPCHSMEVYIEAHQRAGDLALLSEHVEGKAWPVVGGSR